MEEQKLADTEENYRMYLAYLASQTKSKGNSRYYNKFLNKCRDQAAAAFPNGAKQANKSDMKEAGFLGAIAVAFGAFFG